MSKVLILYGTRYGTTKEISNMIDEILQVNGLTTESYNLKEHSLKEIPPLEEYDGIVVGTGIKIKKWTKAVKKFVEKRKLDLTSKQKTLGFYVCCGDAANKSKIGKAISEYITPRLQKLGIEPVLIDAFGGAYDLREDSPISGMMRKIVVGILEKEEGIENPDGKLHDFRDWDQVEDFANKFVEILKN